MELLNKHVHGSPPDSVYIGRGSVFGNLKVIGQDGTREQVIDWYKGWLKDKLIGRDANVEKAFRNLTANSKLLCFCHPKPCHGQVIIDYWNEIDSHGDYETGLKAFRLKYMPEFQYVPKNDGIDHINVYSKGQTNIGRALSNFAHVAFDHPEHGRFQSVEGFWYWLATGKQHDSLKEVHGYNAKKMGREFPRVKIENFIQEVKQALLCKITQNKELAEYFKDTTLPLTHYYFYGDVDNPKIVPESSAKWFIEYLETIRRYLQGKAHKVIIAGSRSIDTFQTVKQAYDDSHFEAVEIVSGRAKGVDRLGEELARQLQIPVRYFIPDWNVQGRSAGMIRNRQMGDYASALVACWDGVSPGTKGMIDYMRSLNKAVHVSKCDPVCKVE